MYFVPNEFSEHGRCCSFAMVLIVLISGKRFCGKDTLATALYQKASSHFDFVQIIHFSDELKKLYAQSVGADYQRLIQDREYKVYK